MATEILCKYLIKGEQCTYKLATGKTDLPSKARQDPADLDWFGEDKLPEDATNWCYAAKPFSTINTIGKSQKDCDRFKRSENPRPWEQLVP